MDEFSGACKCIELQLQNVKLFPLQVSVFLGKHIQNIQHFGTEVR